MSYSNADDDEEEDVEEEDVMLMEIKMISTALCDKSKTIWRCSDNFSNILVALPSFMI
jgi:hypothetical protein